MSSGFRDLTDLFRRRRFAAARADFTGQTTTTTTTTTSRYEEELRRQRILLGVILTPEIKLWRTDVPVNVQQLLTKSNLNQKQQEWSSHLDQKETEPPKSKEKQEEMWIIQEGEQLQGLQEVKVEEKEDEKPETRHQQNRESFGKADVETHLQSDSQDRIMEPSDPEPEVGDKDRKDLDRKSFCCCVCGKRFQHKGNLDMQMRIESGGKPLSCSLCSRRFTRKVGLEGKSYSCSICAKTFANKGALTYHVITHTEVKRFSCSDCGRRFLGMSQLRLHKCIKKRSKSHTSKKTKKSLSCPDCDISFTNNYLLVTHMKMHKGKKLFTCTVCGQKRQFSSHLEIHMRTHTGEKPYSCSICGKRYSQRGIMTQHMATHSGLKPFSCTDCGRRFYWKFQVEKHKCAGRVYHRRRVDEKAYTASKHLRRLDAHLKSDAVAEAERSVQSGGSNDIEFWKETRKHQLGVTYQRNKKISINDGCLPGSESSVCSYDASKNTAAKANTANIDLGKQARQLQSQPNHLKPNETSVSDPQVQRFSFFSFHRNSADTSRKCETEERTFSCLFCGKGFATGGHLTRHISVHTGEDSLSCIVCEQRFSIKSEMISHVCVEPGEPPQIAKKTFSCSHCVESFSLKQNLLLHMKTHTEEKPFSCSVCGQIFSQHQSLSLHMACHTVEKPSCCSVCNTGFIDSESLIKHMRIHVSGQTQFSCAICGKEFAWRRHLMKHMEVHTPEQIYSCEPLHTEQEETRANGEDCREEETSQSSHTNVQPDEGNDDRRLQPALNPPDKGKRRSRGKKSHICSECGRGFRRKDNLTTHMLVHTGEKPFSCSECGKTFKHKRSLTLHTALHKGEKLFSCSVCEQRFSWCSQLKNHVCVVGVQGRQAVRVQTSRLSPGTHSQPEVPAEGVLERVESCILNPEKNLQSHTQFKTKDSSGPETEDINDAFREDTSALNVRKDEGSKTAGACDTVMSRVSSSESDETFYTHQQESNMMNHTGEKHLSGPDEDLGPAFVKEEHEEVWINQPDVAPVDIKSEEDEEKLNILHKERSSDGDECLTISLKTENSADSDFWTEIRERPANLKEEESSDIAPGCCGTTDDKTSLDPESGDSVDSDFWKEGSRKSQAELNSLTEDADESEASKTRKKPHSCLRCGKSFNRIYNLKYHMRLHQGERAFVCPVCGLKCLYTSHLKIHMRTHTGEKPFTCPVCGKKYAHKGSMQNHMAVHTADKQYSCSACKEGFTWFTELKYHQCVGESSQETKAWREKTALNSGDQ